MKKKNVKGLEEADITVLGLREFKAEDYLTSRASINAFMSEALKSGDDQLIAMAEKTIQRAKRK